MSANRILSRLSRDDFALLEPHLEAACIALSKALGLAFTGIGLRITPDGEVYCFEVNPSPAYSYYEANTGQPISTALARYLIDTN